MGTLLLLGFVLSLDSFRVSFALGALKLLPRRQAQIVLAFGLCDGIAPLVGLLIGQSIVTHIGGWVEHLGPFVLCAYGVYVIYAARQREEKEAEEEAHWMVLGLPLSLSLDNLVAGASLGMIGFPKLVSAVVIGTISALMSLAGLLLGRTAVKHLSLQSELLGGTALVLIALFMAYENR
ncbi:MAG TPA: manganese efflux pump [Blastocatellia bacterium]|nr:manganese efflux pump [Blastocatellia bacterium]